MGRPVLRFPEITVDPTMSTAPSSNPILQAAIDQSEDAVIIFDRRGRVSFVNPAFVAWTERPAEELLGRHIWQLPGFPRTRTDLAWARHLLGSGRTWRREYEVHEATEGGGERRRFVSVSVSSILGPEGEIEDFVVIGRDITERRRLESIAEAHNLHDNLGVVFAGIRHELGNPVNSIKSALALLNGSFGELPPDKVKSYLERMSEEVGRVEYLLRSFRAYNLFQQPRIEEIELASFLTRFRDLGKRELEARGMSLVLALSSGLGSVAADPQALHQVLLNLVNNAATALEGRPGARILVRASARRHHAHLIVRDNGPGIPPAQLERVFQPFFTTRAGGTGLGLPICRRLISLMHGTIEVQSTGEGTEVHITLDRSRPAIARRTRR